MTFAALKYVLVQASLLYPRDYQRDYFMYVVATISTATMVLLQEDEVHVDKSSATKIRRFLLISNCL